MADNTTLKMRITGESQSAVAAAQEARKAIVDNMEQARQEVAKKDVSLDFDRVFSQLTQFRIGLTQLGRGDLGGIPNLIKGVSLAGETFKNVTPTVATFQQTITALDATLAAVGTKRTATSLFDSFLVSVNKAATGTDEKAKAMRATLEKFGVDVERALVNPKKAFTDFVRVLGTGVSGSELKNASKVLDISLKTVTDATVSGGKAIGDYEAATTAAARANSVLAGGLSLTVIGIGAVVGVAIAAGVALLAMGVKAADTAENLRKINEETGLSLATIQRFTAAAQVLDVDLKTVLGSYTRFKDATTQARLGNEEVLKSFQILGITAKEAADNPQESYKKLVFAIANLKDEGIKAEASQRILKLSLGELSGVVKVLTEDGGRLSARLDELGEGMSGENLEAARRYKEELGFLEAAWDRFAEKLGTKVYPILTDVLKLMTANPGAIFGVPDTNNPLAKLGDDAKVVSGGVDFLTQSESDFGDAVRTGTKAIDAQSKALEELYRKKDKAAKQKDPAALNDLREQENYLRSVDEQYRTFNEQLQQRLNERLLSESKYTKKLIEGAEERLRATNQILDDEVDIINGANFDPNKRQEALLKVQREREKITEETQRSIGRINSDARVRERDATERFQQEILQTQQLYADRQIALTQYLTDQQILSEEEGQRRLTTIQIEQLNQRIAAQQALVNTFPDGSQQKVLENEKLKQLEVQRVNIELDGLRRRNILRRQEIANARAANTELQQIYAAARQARIDLQATFAGNAQSVIQQNAQLQIKAIDDQRSREKEAAKEKLTLLALASLTENADLDQITAKRAEILNKELALEQEAADKKALIRRQAKVDAQNADPLSTRSLAGDGVADEVDKLSTKLSGVQTILQSFRAGFKATVNGMRADAQQPLQAIGALTGKMAAGFVLSGLAAISAGQGIGAALKQTAAATIASIAQIAGVKAIQNVALAIEESGKATADAAIGNIPGAALHAAAAKQHLLAAAQWGLIGFGAALGAGALSGGGGSASASGGAGTSLTGTRQDQNTVNTEERFRYRESGAGRPVTTIILVTDQAQQIKNVETAFVTSYNNDGPAKKVIDNATSGRPMSG